MIRYYFDPSNRFVIEEYDQARPFASFLPGVAGLRGIPLWAFYVNRGQGIASLGVRDKNGAIVEFFPANKAYQLVSFVGFRTFIKILAEDGPEYYEPFSPLGGRRNQKKRVMRIAPSELELEECRHDRGLRVTALYFILPNEDFGGLVRSLRVENMASQPVNLEVLDGLPIVIPYGVDDGGIKGASNTLQAWMTVSNLEQGVPFYHLCSSSADLPEVEGITGGHFYFSFACDREGARLLPPIVDPEVVFNSDTSLSYPDGFLERPLRDLQSGRQITSNRVPCGMFGLTCQIEPGQETAIYSVVGHVGLVHTIVDRLSDVVSKEYMERKRQEAQGLIDGLTASVETHTSHPRFDAYCRQNFLDNLLRGGYPIPLGSAEKPLVYHVYSRKHGDLERDYNFFSLLPEFYSQGNGNYRDVNQNRRSDVIVFPWIGDFNIVTFLSLIQPDGYNPLVVGGSSFVLEERRVAEALMLVEQEADRVKVERLLRAPFRPGQLLQFITERRISLKVSVDEFLHRVLAHAEQVIQAEFGEGYWVDHWVYNLDLIESFLYVYPDKKEELLFDRNDYMFFDSPARVLPRCDKYVLVDGRVKQLGAVLMDEAKQREIASRACNPNFVRTEHGKGAIYKTNLFSKLLALALVKFATLDPWGMGVEMEANRPGWCDALNGLPGLFGSSMCETYELRRLIAFMLQALDECEGFSCRLPIELYDLFQSVGRHLDAFYASDDHEKDYVYWDRVAGEREAYRERVWRGFDGEEKALSRQQAREALMKWAKKVDEGISRARGMSGGLYPTYFYYNAAEYEVIRQANGEPKASRDGRPNVRVTRFEPVAMPFFLEGFVKALKIQSDQAGAREIYRRVRVSELFDRELKMYKSNKSVEGQPYDIGRIKAFRRGWLENESVWLHMEYKYLLEVLRCGLYEEFFQDFRNALIPFQDPAVYGRSPLENSSFIVSSAHANEALHGRGFVGRLSGATAEFISIWVLMMAGPRPFFVRDGRLCLELRPILPGWLFDHQGRASFRFLGRCMVTYHNPRRADTFGEGAPAVCRAALTLEDGSRVEIEGGLVGDPYAALVRAGRVKALDLFLDGGS